MMNKPGRGIGVTGGTVVQKGGQPSGATSTGAGGSITTAAGGGAAGSAAVGSDTSGSTAGATGVAGRAGDSASSAGDGAPAGACSADTQFFLVSSHFNFAGASSARDKPHAPCLHPNPPPHPINQHP